MQFTNQAGIITRSQALKSGLTPGMIRSKLDHGLWQRVHHATYATFNGELPRLAVIWAALLAAGDGAVVSHQTAAELLRFGPHPQRTVDLTIPFERHPPVIPGTSVHRSRRLADARHPTRSPPQTRIDETVFDLTDRAATLDAAVSWLTAACGGRLTTPDRLLRTMARRPRLRWRRELSFALRDFVAGARSPLERRYLSGVERAHRLPAGARQVQRCRPGGHIYDDVSYDAFGLVVELDGQAAHPFSSRFRDLVRDNVAAMRGDIVLHYGWDDVTRTPCRVAAEVAEILRARGWDGRPARCHRPDCMIVASRGSI